MGVTGRHCESFIADEYDDGQARNGDRTTPPCIHMFINYRSTSVNEIGFKAEFKIIFQNEDAIYDQPNRPIVHCG